MDDALELIIKVLLAVVLFWMFQRLSHVLIWMLQPFVWGFIAGFLVAILFVIRLRRV